MSTTDMTSSKAEAEAVMSALLSQPVVRCYCERELAATPGQGRMTCTCGRKWREIGGPVAQCSWLQWLYCDKNWKETGRRGRKPVTIYLDNAGQYTIRAL